MIFVNKIDHRLYETAAFSGKRFLLCVIRVRTWVKRMKSRWMPNTTINYQLGRSFGKPYSNYQFVFMNEIVITEHSTTQGGERYG